MSIIGLTFLGLCLSPALAVLTPENHCDNHFRYDTEDDGRTHIGIFTAPKLDTFNFRWKATFEVQGSSAMFVTRLQTYPTKDLAVINLLNGEPAQAFLRFININTELPKLRSLVLNGNELCSSPRYPFPKTSVTLNYHMFVNVNEGRNLTTETPIFENNL
ncbi:uncharacterized protein LOC121467551 [Drosophila elegans]|uniref:uncharacterized protein LOC121467551 n=1 Tax=Drosophila elegans TaxID=30023 RepID=UPI001BC8379C|nr:uncharacterized protein LOC121467551 [Drosophila elegans]